MTEHEQFVKQYEDSLGKGMIARDYCYKGGSTLVRKTDAYTSYDYVDDRDTSPSIRVVGTLKEIKKLQKEFEDRNSHLYLDEVYEANKNEYKLKYEREGAFIVNY